MFFLAAGKHVDTWRNDNSNSTIEMNISEELEQINTIESPFPN